jgi:PKHD-type hydroxylase
MNLKGLYNFPNERSRITYPWVYWDNGFTPEELDKMCAYFETAGVERGTTVGAAEKGPNGELIINQAPNEAVRKSNVKFHNFDPSNENTNWIFHRLNSIIEQANNMFYGFDLNGFETFQYTEYDESENGRYDFHMDTIMGKNMPTDMIETRKLSVTLCLNEAGVDYEGGEFQINSGQEKDAETTPAIRGRAFLFPSFMIHRVAPVTKGKRKSLVVWCNGPKFK